MKMNGGGDHLVSGSKLKHLPVKWDWGFFGFFFSEAESKALMWRFICNISRFWIDFLSRLMKVSIPVSIEMKKLLKLLEYLYRM